MFEYRIYNEDVLTIIFSLREDDYQLYEGCLQYHGDYIWYFQAKNIFVIQSQNPFGDGNILLDEILLKLAKTFSVHDIGI
jgi:hypothetical protein